MDAHFTEVMAKARLEERARVHIERLAGGTQHFVNDGGDFGMLMVES
jgi:hypothetical protein